MVIAKPETQTEYNDLLRFFNTNGYVHASQGRAFIGISKHGGYWCESESQRHISYSITWFPAQPSGDGTCSEILRESGHLGLNDLSCGHSRSVICEKKREEKTLIVFHLLKL